LGLQVPIIVFNGWLRPALCTEGSTSVLGYRYIPKPVPLPFWPKRYAWD